MVKRAPTQADSEAVLTLTSGAGEIAVSGVFNADPDTNLQVVTVTVEDTDTDDISPGTYHWELKRTDAGFETPLGYGTIAMKRGVHHA